MWTGPPPANCEGGQGQFRRQPTISEMRTHVEDAINVAPTSRVPGPARDRVVDDGRPEEADDEHGKKTRALSNTSDGLPRAGISSCL